VEKPTANDPKWLKDLDTIKEGQQQNLLTGKYASIKNWCDDVKDGGTLNTAATGKALVWLEKFSAEDVKSGKMT
jgi:hypothetical protein